jgi:uncharacterized protein YfaS (alpha-2-macroglobulin family)
LQTIGVLLLVLTLLASPRQAAALTVATDQAQYLPGDWVTGYVTLPCPCSEPLMFYVDKPDGRNLAFGIFENLTARMNFRFRLPEDAPYGNYTITITIDHEYAQTWFLVSKYFGPVPEFSGLALVTFSALAASLFLLRRRRK